MQSCLVDRERRAEFAPSGSPTLEEAKIAVERRCISFVGN